MLRWTTAAPCALLFLLWLHSGWYTISAQVWRISAVTWHGELALVRYPAGTRPLDRGVSVFRDQRRAGGPWEWWFHFDDTTVRAPVVMIPIWAPILVAGAPCGWLWVRARRTSSAFHCAACRYDLRGLAPGATCPECGATPPRCAG